MTCADDAKCLNLTPPASQLARLSDQADLLSKTSGTTVPRIKYFAVTQLACCGDDLAAASGEIAFACHHDGSTCAAARSALHTEDGQGNDLPAMSEALDSLCLLTEEWTLDRQYLNTLGSFPRAASAYEHIYGLRDLLPCTFLRACARMAVERNCDFAKAESLLLRERELLVLPSLHGRGSSGEGRVPVDTSLSMMAMGELVELDHERASLMLLHAKLLDHWTIELRSVFATDDARGSAAAPDSVGERAQVCGKQACSRSSAIGVGAVVGDVLTGSTTSSSRSATSTFRLAQDSIAPRVTRASFFKRSSHWAPHRTRKAQRPIERTKLSLAERQSRLQRENVGFGGVDRYLINCATEGSATRQAVAVACASATGLMSLDARDIAVLALRKRTVAADVMGRGDRKGNEGTDTAVQAKFATQLAIAYRELGLWERAEAAYLRAISYHELHHGASSPAALRLWGDVAESRMNRGAYGLAARDLAHIVATTALHCGYDSSELVSSLEKLCKAHILSHRWQQGRHALSRALAIIRECNGIGHRDTMRIEELLRSLQRHQRLS